MGTLVSKPGPGVRMLSWPIPPCMTCVYLLSPLLEVQLYKGLGLLRPPGVNILGEFGVLWSALGTFLQ